MDFKGVSWAGDIYQKFEAMCLEVEEVMYQDTVKYVENQAEKVGASVKKFYSEVIQDLLPPSCVGPVKVAAGDLSMNPSIDADLMKKPKSFLLDSPRELKKIKTEDETIPDTILPPLSSGVLVQNTCYESCSSKSKKLGIHRRAVAINRIPRLDRPSKVSSPTTSLGHMSNDSSSSGGGSHLKVSSDMNMKSPPISVERHDSESASGSMPVSDAKIESSVLDEAISAESARQKKDDSECTSSLGTSANCTSLSQIGSSVTANACDIPSVGEKVVKSDEETTVKLDLHSESAPEISHSTRNVEFSVEEVVPSDEDDFSMEVIQDEVVGGPRIATFDAFEVTNLEETCVFVEGEDLDFVLQGSRKHKSYKKKIRDILSSKLRSTSKEVYPNTRGKNYTEATIPAESDRKEKITVRDSLESEWELL